MIHGLRLYSGDGHGTGAEGNELGNGYDSYSFFGNGFGEGLEGYGLADGDGGVIVAYDGRGSPHGNDGEP